MRNRRPPAASHAGFAPVSSPDPGETPRPTLLELFGGFTRIAAFAFGGVLPWARFVLVERRKWLTADEFTDMLALCQLLPGPNIVNMSVAIGGRFRGPAGAVVSVLGLMMLPTAIVLCLGAFYARFADVPAVGNALTAMGAAAAGLVIAMAAKIGEPVLRRRFLSAAPFVLATFVAVAILRLPLWPVILALAPLAIAAAWRLR
ncbi:MAG: chromate transporter [Enterovirga sp.]|jgi:chromate transporter|nr:chromate transporter [Enterovirga sp.]